MEQFNLDIWLKDRSRKVVTRDGRPVRIVCWDCKNEQPIIALTLEPKLGIEIPRMYSSNGVYHSRIESSCDLFFADEKKTNKILDELKSYLENTPKEQVEKDWKEIQGWYAQHFTNKKHNEKEKLTEFEKEMQEYYFPELDDFELKRFAKGILDLARKELEKNYYTKVLDDRMVFKAELHSTDLQTAYDMGKQDALKDFPKWKKCVGSTGPFIDDFRGEDYLYLKDYVIKVSELFEKLPKEE